VPVRYIFGRYGQENVQSNTVDDVPNTNDDCDLLDNSIVRFSSARFPLSSFVQGIEKVFQTVNVKRHFGLVIPVK
jgi:hypothetical protein